MGSIEILKVLMQAKANMNAVDDLGESVLHSAIRAGQTDMVKMLIANKASKLDAVNKEKQTPLHILALGGKDSATEVLQIL
jgi:ankyrin repeat protein